MTYRAMDDLPVCAEGCCVRGRDSHRRPPTGYPYPSVTIRPMILEIEDACVCQYGCREYPDGTLRCTCKQSDGYGYRGTDPEWVEEYAEAVALSVFRNLRVYDQAVQPGGQDDVPG